MFPDIECSLCGDKFEDTDLLLVEKRSFEFGKEAIFFHGVPVGVAHLRCYEDLMPPVEDKKRSGDELDMDKALKFMKKKSVYNFLVKESRYKEENIVQMKALGIYTG